MKTIIIKLSLDAKDVQQISFDEKFENGHSMGETVIKDWEKFKNASLNDIVGVHTMYTTLKHACCHVGITAEELLEMKMSEPNEIFISKIVQFLKSLAK